MRRLISFLSLIAYQVLRAQEDPELHFEKITGLSQNTVYSISKDRQGFMWIATADGLNRYDGVEMKIYKPSASNENGKLKGRFIRTKVFEDDNDDLWFSSELTLFRFNKKKDYFEDYYFGDTPGTEQNGLSVEPVLQKGNRYWFVNASYGIIEYNRSGGIYKRHALPSNDHGKPVYIQPLGVFDNNNKLWFASNTGVFSFNIYDHQWRHYLSGENFYRILFVSDAVYLTSGRQIFYFDIERNSVTSVLVENKNSKINNSDLRALYVDNNNTIWAGDENGNVFCKKKESGYFEWRGNINNNNPADIKYPVYCFYKDENGSLWAGSDVLGLLRATINYSGFNSFPSAGTKNERLDLFINAVYEDEDDKVWLGVFTKGVMLLDKKRGTLSPVTLPGMPLKNINDIRVNFIKKDEDGNFWIGHSGYLLVREKGSKKFKQLKIPMPFGTISKSINGTCIIKFRDKWLLGTTLGLYYIEKKNVEFVITRHQNTSESTISDLWNNNNKEFWLGFESSGLLISKKDLSFIGNEMLFIKAGVKSFYYDSTHHLNWISTLSGLIAYHIPTGRYKIFTEADGLGNSYTYGCLVNGNELWVSTNKGLSKAIVTWNKNDVLPVLSFVNYTKSDGLPDNEFNTGAFHKGKSGYFYFGTVKGICWFKPEEINSNPSRPVVRLLDIKVNEEKADTSTAAEFIQELSLPYFKNNLYFRFRGIEYFNPSNVSYEYKMEGQENDWINSGTLNEVRYNGLPPGSYTFRIKAANGSGVWSKNEVHVKIYIHAPFWATWWFYTLIGLLSIGAIIIITRYISQNRLKEKVRRLEKLQVVEAERSRISKDMHDEIGSGLTRIALMTELMHTQKQLDEKTKQGVNEIAGSTRQLVESMSEIIWALNPHNDKLEDLLAYLREQTRHYFEPLNINYKISFPDTVPDITLSNEQRRNFFLVSKEALNNALKHSGASSIQFIADTADGKIKFSVIDNGKGIDGSPKRTGANGLHNMQQRMKDINGGIEWLTQNGSGTRVNFWIEF